MGYNTTVLILNDGASYLKEHPVEFANGVYREMMRGVGADVAVGPHLNCVHVMPTAHADEFRLYATHGNMITDLGAYKGYAEFVDICSRGPEIKDYMLGLIRKAEDNLKQMKKQLKADGII